MIEVYAEVLVALLLAAAVVSGWRGGWMLLDALLFPSRPVSSVMASTVAGGVMMALLCRLQPVLADFARTRQSLSIWLLDALFSYLCGWVCICYWRGIWLLWDLGDGRGRPAAELDVGLAIDGAVCHACGVGMLLIFGALRNMSAPPMLIGADSAKPLFGASVTAGLGALNPLIRCRPPPQQSADAWRAAVWGLPASQVNVELPASEPDNRTTHATQAHSDCTK